MNKKKFILNILKKIDSMKEGIITHAYLSGNSTMTHTWYEVSISDYEFYTKNEEFKRLCDIWHKLARKNGFKVVFVCGWMPKEKQLVELLEQDNLIMDA